MSVPNSVPPDPARAEQLRGDIAARLRRVCAHLSDEQFAELVHRIADVTLRYEERPTLSPPMNETRKRPGGQNR